MENQQQPTGATNIEYDLFSEIHSLLKGNSALEKYIEDAKGAGDKEVESCFQSLHDQNKQHVEELRGLIEKRIVGSSSRSGSSGASGSSEVSGSSGAV